MDNKNINAIRRLTARNEAGKAYLMIATLLGEQSLVDRFNDINAAHDRIGELPLDLYQKRSAAYQELMQKAKAKLPAQDYQKLYMAT